MSNNDDRVPLSGKTPWTPDGPAPTPETRPDGQHTDYWVLSEEERAKGFVRPLRFSYIHVGLPVPKYPLRELTKEEHDRYSKFGYAKWEQYPESELPTTGRFWTVAELKKIEGGCKTVTTISNREIAETYARNPKFYGSTFCIGCGEHLPVNEFVWMDSNDRVGS